MRLSWLRASTCVLVLIATASAPKAQRETNAADQCRPEAKGSRYPTEAHPLSGEIMRKDREEAERENRRLQQEENRRFANEYKKLLNAYVEGRLAEAEYRARSEFLRREHEKRQEELSGNRGSGSEQRTVSASTYSRILEAWLPSSKGTSGQPSSRIGEATRKVVTEIPIRTREVMRGNDELIRAHESYGLPKGVAVILALLMLHVPSLAVALMVAGIFLIRARRMRAAGFLLAVSTILIVVIFTLIPW